jgi:hypothetical protein
MHVIQLKDYVTVSWATEKLTDGCMWPMTDLLWPHWMMQWLLSNENKPER